MSLTPAIVIHMSAAIGAVVLGPVALWARKGRTQRPRLHRAFGYAWVTLMVVTALSALFIHESKFNFAGWSPIHLLIPVSLYSLYRAFRALARRDIATHRKTMQFLYIGACVVAGVFTLSPDRIIGRALWSSLPSLGFVGQVVSHTPVWVWGLLAGLVALGLSQVRNRRASLTRIAVMPLAMGAFSVWGMVSAFGADARVIVAWLAAVVVVVALFMRLGAPQGVGYDAGSRTFELPGSWMPLALILGIFFTRYIVNVNLAIHPELRTQADVVFAVSVLYGAFSGIFAGRALRLMTMVLPQDGFPLWKHARLQLQRDPW